MEAETNKQRNKQAKTVCHNAPPTSFCENPIPPEKNQIFRATRGIQSIDMWALAHPRAAVASYEPYIVVV